MAPVFNTYGTTENSTQLVWTNWTQSSDSANVTYVWNQWNATITSAGDVWPIWTLTQDMMYAPSSPLTEEQLAQHRQEAEERAACEKLKRERAAKLLREALDRKQQQELAKQGYFHVETKDGTRRYRLSPGSAPRRVHGEDGRQWSYCIHPDYGYPPEDVVLAQKLLLETDEETFLRIANATMVRST